MWSSITICQQYKTEESFTIMKKGSVLDIEI